MYAQVEVRYSIKIENIVVKTGALHSFNSDRACYESYLGTGESFLTITSN